MRTATQKFSHHTNNGAVFKLTSGDIEVSGRFPSHALCRELIDKAIDGELMVYDEAGTLRYTVPSIWYWSTLQTTENDSGFRTGLYKKYGE